LIKLSSQGVEVNDVNVKWWMLIYFWTVLISRTTRAMRANKDISSFVEQDCERTTRTTRTMRTTRPSLSEIVREQRERQGHQGQ
jgi:hypothetical protein